MLLALPNQDIRESFNDFLSGSFLPPSSLGIVPFVEALWNIKRGAKKRDENEKCETANYTARRRENVGKNGKRWAVSYFFSDDNVPQSRLTIDWFLASPAHTRLTKRPPKRCPLAILAHRAV